MTHHQTDTPQFFLTAPTPCPYLPGQMERKVFTHLVGARASALNEILTQGGFRRSQNIAYRPACESCKACVSVRVPIFRDYLDARHSEGGMADMTMLDYAMMVEDTHVETMLVEYRFRGPDSALTGRGDGALIGTALTDILSDGLSMVYSFYEPSYAERSLGSFMILDHIARARKMGLPYVYLGYWVAGSRKMAYKARYQPQEHLGAQGWEVAPPA
jgi:arginine-tRNA-protein transferase